MRKCIELAFGMSVTTEDSNFVLDEVQICPLNLPLSGWTSAAQPASKVQIVTTLTLTLKNVN